MEGTFVMAATDTYCRDCEIGREHARREVEMKKKKNQPPPPVASKPPPPPPPPAAIPFSWSDLLGETLVEDFLQAAKDNGRSPGEHLRHVVGEYLYLESLGV
jgi:hypothetical protein